jgi:hypothetical protein
MNAATLTMAPTRPLEVIVADDEPADNLLLAMAAQDAHVEMNFTFAEDGDVHDVASCVGHGARPQLGCNQVHDQAQFVSRARLFCARAR